MKFELLDDRTVKVLLSKLDMNNLKLTYDEMDYKNPDTKRVLLKLLDDIKQEIDIDLSTGKLFIEAFPYADGGCILYVNIMEFSCAAQGKKKKASFDTPLIFSVEDIAALGQSVKAVSDKYNHMILKSALYLFKNRYYIFLYTYCRMDGEISKFICEYAQYAGKGPVAAALIKEHGEELIRTDALSTLNECLN